MTLDFQKNKGLIPVIIQDNLSLQVLMLGYMNEAAYDKTKTEGRVTFFSRSKERLWTKGEESGNYLSVVEISQDCDDDTLLIKATPTGPTCHTGNTSCFKEETSKGFMYRLESTISTRIDQNDEDSYTNKLFRKGINKVAQKVGEEAVEVVIEAIDDNKERLVYESADLLYHLIILLKAKGLSLADIETELQGRAH
jgi:phosphoribosyl-ATP pyrophosphohydrolase/phosphoribosyl-AMP cyclohydrolase